PDRLSSFAANWVFQNGITFRQHSYAADPLASSPKKIGMAHDHSITLTKRPSGRRNRLSGRRLGCRPRSIGLLLLSATASLAIPLRSMAYTVSWNWEPAWPAVRHACACPCGETRVGTLCRLIGCREPSSNYWASRSGSDALSTWFPDRLFARASSQRSGTTP